MDRNDNGSHILKLTCPKCGKVDSYDQFVVSVHTPADPEACFECHYGPEEESDEEGESLQAPLLMKAMPAYVSPATQKVVNDRDERRDDLKRSGCVDANDLRPEGLAADKPRPYTNKRFIKKWNLEADAAEGVLDS